MYEIEYIDDKIKYYYDELNKKYDVVYIALYGSQNYGLDIYTDEYMSDVDAKAIVIPSLDDLIECRKISTTVEFDSGMCDVKDIRVYAENIFKANLNYLETMFTDFKIINPESKKDVERFLNMGEEIVQSRIANLFKTSYGMAKDKFNNLTKIRPSSLEDIMKFGYSPKELHHILRIYFLLQKYYVISGNFKESLYPYDQKDFLIDVKLGKLPLNEALILGESYIEKIERMTNYVVNTDGFNSSIKSKLDNVVYDIIKNRIISKIKKE